MVVGQIEAKLLMDRSNFTQGIKLTQHEMSLLIPNMVAAANAEKQVAGQAKETDSAFESLGTTATATIATFAAFTGAAYGLWSAFKDIGNEETAINRVVHAAQRLRLETAGLREAAGDAGTAAILAGQEEMAGISGLQKLIQVTKDRAQAQYLLGVAIDFTKEHDVALTEVVHALTLAYGGNFRALLPLLGEVDSGVKQFKTFGDVMTAVKFASEGANGALSDQANAVFGLNAQWDKLRDTIGKAISPKMVEDLDVITRILDAVNRGKIGEALNTKYRTYAEIQMANKRQSQSSGGWHWWTDEDWKRAEEEQRWQEMWDKIFRKEEPGGPALAKAPKVKDDLAERIRELEEYMRLQDELYRAAEQNDKDLTDRWEKDHRIQMSLLDGTGQQFKSVFVDLVTEGKFNIEDFGKSFLRMLAEVAASEMWGSIRDNMRSLWGFGSWRAGGTTGAMYGGQGVDYNPGGGAGMAGRGGPRFPEIPASAPAMPMSQPVTVISKNYFSLDAEKFADAHSEMFVRKGLSQAAALGR